MKRLPLRITNLRKESGMSQAQLAKKLNVSPSALGNYEQGRRLPNVDLLIQMSQLFNVSLDYLITGVEYGHKSKIEQCPCNTCYWKDHIQSGHL